MTDRIILNITPQTGIKIVQDTTVLFRMPEDCPVACGLPRRSEKQPMVNVATMKDKFPDMWEALGGDDWKPRKKKKEIRYGCPHCLSRQGLWLKNRLIKMSKYREQLFMLAKEQGFELPDHGFSVYFYFPMPVQWPLSKRKKMAGQPHKIKSDLDNIYKLWVDSLRTDDEKISQVSGMGKFWIERMYKDEEGKKHKGEGYIEILLNQPVYNPFGVEFINQQEAEPQKRKRTKRKPGYEKRTKRKIKPVKIREDLLR